MAHLARKHNHTNRKPKGTQIKHPVVLNSKKGKPIMMSWGEKIEEYAGTGIWLTRDENSNNIAVATITVR